jgi:hypothetical protein
MIGNQYAVLTFLLVDFSSIRYLFIFFAAATIKFLTMMFFFFSCFGSFVNFLFYLNKSFINLNSIHKWQETLYSCSIYKLPEIHEDRDIHPVRYVERSHNRVCSEKSWTTTKDTTFQSFVNDIVGGFKGIVIIFKSNRLLTVLTQVLSSVFQIIQCFLTYWLCWVIKQHESRSWDSI